MKLDLDAFDEPLDAKIYIDYKNTGTKSIIAILFRLHFLDSAGKILGVFHSCPPGNGGGPVAVEITSSGSHTVPMSDARTLPELTWIANGEESSRSCGAASHVG